MGQKLETISSGAEAVRWITNHKQARNIRWAGDHCTAEGPDGRVTVAASKREWPRGLRRKVILELVAIGLGVLLAVIWLN
jgi:hypothetical protein